MDDARSFAGTWGRQQRLAEDQRRSDQGLQAPRPKPARFVSETHDRYSQRDAAASKTIRDNKFDKFRTIQRSGTSVMGTNQDAAAEGDSRPTSRASAHDEDFPLSTTFRDSYRPPAGPESDGLDLPLQFSRTNSKLLRTPDAPVARGRSGLRGEHGVMTSGLSGERLMLRPEPAQNSLCQRAWLYTRDPALAIKMKGRPTVEITPEISQLSLQIGSEPGAGSGGAHAEEAQVHARAMVVTGGVLTKTGYTRSAVFRDDNDAALVFAQAQSRPLTRQQVFDERMDSICRATASYQALPGFDNAQPHHRMGPRTLYTSQQLWRTGPAR